MNDDTRFIFELQDQRDAALKERDQLRAELERVTKLKDTLLIDSTDDETRIRAITAPILGQSFVDGDSFGVPGVVGIVERLAQELEQSKRREAVLKDALSALVSAATSFHDYNVHGDCCGTCSGLADAVENAEKSLQPDAGHDYLSREQVKPLVEALEGVVNSACHPDVAVRSVMVPLDPVRKALAHAKQLGL